MAHSSITPEMNQIEIHPFLQQNEMLDFCHKNNIHLTAYSPLGSMDRDDFLKSKNEPSLLEHPIILEIAMSHQCSPAQVLISWSISRNIAIIPKSTNKGRIGQNFKAQKINLTESELSQIYKLNKNYRYVNGTFFAFEGSTYSLEDLWDEY
jgi:alcohol dehydrogenase (NADP+)